MKLWTLMLVVGIAALAGTASANLLVNSDFGLPGAGNYGQINTVTIPNWTSYGASGWYTDDIGTQPSVKFWATDTAIYQDWDAMAGQAYNFVAFGYQRADDHLVSGEGYLKVEWYDATFVTKLGETVLDTMVAGDAYDSWVGMSGTATAAVGTVHGRLVLGLQGELAGDELYFDNAGVDVSAIPEPTVIGLSGLGIALLVHLRKRRAA